MELPVDGRRAAHSSTATAIWARVGPAEFAVALVCALIALIATVGGDARWLPALGRTVVEQHGIPHGVPYAAALSGGWPNVPVLAELILHALVGPMDDRGFLLAQLLAVGTCLAVVVTDARRGNASGSGAGIVVLLVALGAFPAFFVIRVQLFSLVMFSLVVALLRAQSRKPSRAIWLLPALLALWSNLHGAVLVGLAVSAVYLLVDRARRRPAESTAVLLATVLAICLTPALERTPAYYLGVLHSEEARRAEGLWAPLSFSGVVDLVLVGVAVVLIALALRARPRPWEIVSIAALAFLTFRTERSGVWLLLFAAAPAARSIRVRLGNRPWALLTVTAAAVVGFGLISGPGTPGAASSRLVAETVRLAAGTPVLTDGILGEQVAEAGGRVWVSNPLDAFARRDQQLYLDWLAGGPPAAAALVHAPRAVLVYRWSPSRTLIEQAKGLHVVASDDRAVLYLRR